MCPTSLPMHKRLVDQLVDIGQIRDESIERAFRAVPRHCFLPDVPLDKVYSDRSIPLKTSDGSRSGVLISSSSQPSTMATNLEQLEARIGHRVLEIGTGSGYNAAL